METNENMSANLELESKINKIEQDLKGMKKKVSFQEKQLELDSLASGLISIVKKWFWPLFIIFALISIGPLISIMWFPINEKDGVSEVIIAIIKGNISIIVALIIGLVIIICFFIFSKIHRKSKRDKSIF